LIREYKESESGVPNEVEEHSFLREPWHVLFVALLCINAVHFPFNAPWIVATKRRQKLGVPASSHPSHDVRVLNALGLSSYFLKALELDYTSVKLDDDASVHIGHFVLFQVDKILGQIFGELSGWGFERYADEAVFQKLLRQIERISEAERDLIPKLSSHAYIELPPQILAR
jgi:hypothetical protein